MSENRTRIADQGEFRKNDVLVYLENGKVFTAWESLSIEKNLGSLAHQFSMSVNDSFNSGNQEMPLKPGVKVSVFIGDTRVLTGRIEKLSAQFTPDDRSIRISGRSLSGDLVDCSVTGDMEYAGLTIEEIAKKLVAPFGLKVFLSVTLPGPVERLAIKPGETVFTALDRLARIQGFTWVTTREGNIRLTQAGRFRANTELQQSFNIKTAGVEFDDTDRFSQYEVKGQSSGTDEFFGTSATEIQAQARDAGVKRFRPLVVVAEANLDGENAVTRAGWEASTRAGKAAAVACEVDGWRQRDGSLWDINQVTRFKCPFLGIDRDLLIAGVVHEIDNQGTRTKMSLARTDAFLAKPEFSADDDLLTGLSFDDDE